MVESNNDEEKPKEICVADDDNEDKSHTFRKRRLTYTKHHLAAAAAAAAASLEEDGSSASDYSEQDLKRRLTNVDQEVVASSPARKKHKADNISKLLKSRIVHAGELNRQQPSRLSNHLYDTPFRVEPVETEAERASKPEWRHRHTRHHYENDDMLPFPRHVVGTYSCHGVEPVYDSDYEETPGEKDDDDDDDQEWLVDGVGGKELPKESDSAKENRKETPKASKLTTVAKINQDRGGVAYPYGNCNRTALFAAYDGHGQGGELVSQFALHEIQKRLEKHPDFHGDIEKAFTEIFINVDDDLKREPLIEPLYAGTTACVVLLRDKQMTISNAGDSRAVLGRCKTQGEWEAIDLSKDQNPDVPEEQERIERSGGFVSPPPEEGLSARVWLDSMYSQIGLAMARSIGDHAVAPVGVIAEPVVTKHEIQQEDDFLIIATDGVWEFIDSSEAVRIVSEHLTAGATKACQALIEAAASKWHEEEGNYRDDITALVVRLQHLWGDNSAGEQKNE